MGDTFPTTTVAAVQAAPVFLDRESTLDKALALIAEAARHGAELIVFPEVFIAGYPYWNRLKNVFQTAGYFTTLLKNAVEVPSPTTERLCEAARRSGVYVVMGINERPTNTLGTLYNTNLILSPEGRILLKHRKLMPTYAEKLVWGFGDGSSLRVLDTPLGKLGTLICGENANPLARFALLAQGEQIHLSNYPALPAGDAGGYDLGEEIRLRGANHAFEGKVFNVVASAVIDGTVVEKVAETEEERRLMAGPQMSFTGVFAPGGRLISDTVPPGQEGIVYARCDLEAIIGPKLRHDVAGQYNRFDVLALHLNRAPCTPIIEHGPPAWQPAAAPEAWHPAAEPTVQPVPAQPPAPAASPAASSATSRRARRED
ncbi:MAG: carbon-nitrogen hydrolase family protein [Candidatus Lambdaproteobacteria bacterium]|nr:carbon-nitrogen hydrolase family protein [Candidatus Lambdaproteobacteria bacterium]